MEHTDIDTDIPFADYPPTFESLEERVSAAFKTLSSIAESVEVTDADRAQARAVFTGDTKLNDELTANPAIIMQLTGLLSEYDKTVVKSAAQIRTYVTNRLLLDSANPDPRIRLKCYELLGKISDVGLFTDKAEVTLRHRPTEELEQLLRERLMKTLDAEPAGTLPPPVPKQPIE